MPRSLFVMFAVFVVSVLGLSSLMASPVMAQNPLPERRLIVTQDMDFPGGDLQPLFDTTLSACRTTCITRWCWRPSLLASTSSPTSPSATRCQRLTR